MLVGKRPMEKSGREPADIEWSLRAEDAAHDRHPKNLILTI